MYIKYTYTIQIKSSVGSYNVIVEEIKLLNLYQ
jgi:hypothetical protein